MLDITGNMAENQPIYHRKWLPLVDLSYQLRFVTRILMIICCLAVVSSLLATAILWKNMYRPEMESQSHIVSALIGISSSC